MLFLFRVSCIIPFVKPSVSPETDDDQQLFDKLEEMLEEKIASSAIGWAIQQQKLFKDKEKLHKLKKDLRPSCTGRTNHNWALVLLCAEEVRCSCIGAHVS